MRKRICLFLLAFCLLLTACGPAAQPETDTDPAPEVSAPEGTLPESSSVPEGPAEPELSQREKGWLEDIEFLREQYKEKHLHPFYFHSEEEFDYNLDQLSARVGELTDSDMYFELAAIIAGMGDIHTSIQAPDSLYERIFPFDTFYFGGRLYLTDYLEGHEALAPYLLREIVAVNGVDIAYLKRKAESITDPTNSWRSMETFPYCWSVMASFYDWAAGLDAQESYTFQILNENQEVESVEIPVISLEEYKGSAKVYAEGLMSLPLMFSGDQAEYIDWSGGCAYLAIGRMRTLDNTYYEELFQEIAKIVENHPDCRKLAVDLRINPGGYSTSVTYLRNNLHILQEIPFEQVFVLTNGYTTSAGISCLTVFEKELGAVKVGEPTGQFTSFFAHGTSMTGVSVTLPHSQLSVVVSTGWHEGDNPENTVYNKDRRLYEWENTILPDVYVYQDIEDVRQGKDSVIEWVLAQ